MEMPTAETAHFGPVEYAEDTVLEFPNGLPAFEQERKFIALRGDRYEPLLFLQSVATASLAFLAISVQSVVLDYQLELSDEDLSLLGGEASPAETEALALVTVSPEGEVTANLQSPVVIHHRTRRGVQVIQMNSSHSVRHPLGKEAASCS